MLSAHNEITFRDGSTLEPRLTIESKRDNEWLAWKPSGEFASSVSGADKAFWSVGDRLVSFDALRAKFERQSLLAPGAPASSAVRGPAIAADTYGDPFTVTAATREVRTADERFVIEAILSPREKGAPAPIVHFRQQGRELAATDGVGAPDIVRQPDGTVRVRRTVLLANGINVLDVDYEVAGAVHRGASITVQRETAARSGMLPRLWFLGIGTSRYQNPQFNLKYARRDVEDVATEMMAQKGALYSDVQSRVLVDSEVTDANLRKGVLEFLSRASSEDVIIIYLAGHGAQDGTGNLYYMPYASDLNTPYTGFDVSFFQNFLHQRPVSQKAIFFMDICHAGAAGENARGVGTGVSTDDAVKLLVQGTGTVVLASSTGRESSLEGEQYLDGHGAFSAAVLELLRGKASAPEPAAGADTTQIGRNVTVGQLQLYVSRRVPVMTNGHQHPTAPLIANLRDYPVAKAGARQKR
jgi:hypothetical protein